MVEMAKNSDYVVLSVRILYTVVIGFGLLLAAITFHGFSPVLDPIAPVTFLDRISYWMGVHEKSSIVVVELGNLSRSRRKVLKLELLFHMLYVPGAWSTLLFTYVFHRHLSDGTFHIEKEYRTTLLPGLFSDQVASNATFLQLQIEEVLSRASEHLPSNKFRLRLRPDDCQSEECLPPLLVKVSNDALALDENRIQIVIQALTKKLESNSNTSFYFNAEKSLGALNSIDQTALQWFAINLLSHNFKDWRVSTSAIILDVSENDAFITMAVPANRLLPDQRVWTTRHLTAFGHDIKLVTFRYPALGLFSARAHVFHLSSTPKVFSSRDGTSGIDVRSACVNPVCDAFWHWSNNTYHIRGVVNGTYELVRERNGPFAGKRINRPVAKYDYCHRVCAAYVSEKLRVTFEERDGGKADKAIFDSLRSNQHRKVFMAGLLREKSIERGLTLPDMGGNVKMRSFLDSLKHACKVPNTEQPFACLDLMFLATLVDQLLGFKQGSILHSASNVNGMTAEWPIAAAFHVYQNGL